MEDPRITALKERIWALDTGPKRFKSDLARDRVEVEIDCDTEKLYGTIPTAIAYLKKIQSKHPDATLDEHWTGYEDMYMRFVYTRDQTDEEYTNSLERILMVAENRVKERKKSEKMAKLQSQIKDLQDQINKVRYEG